MNKDKLGQETAFPLFDPESMEIQWGMSKRFYAACAAMQGLLANPNTANQIKSQFGDNPMSDFGYEVVCRTAYRIADELLKQGAE